MKQFCVSGTTESETSVAHSTQGGEPGLLDENSQDGDFLKHENSLEKVETFFQTPCDGHTLVEAVRRSWGF